MYLKDNACIEMYFATTIHQAKTNNMCSVMLTAVLSFYLVSCIKLTKVKQCKNKVVLMSSMTPARKSSLVPWQGMSSSLFFFVPASLILAITSCHTRSLNATWFLNKLSNNDFQNVHDELIERTKSSNNLPLRYSLSEVLACLKQF